MDFFSFTFPFTLLYAALFGTTMKIADLCNEHEMRLFKGDAVLFGVLWGVFGSFLILSQVDIANVILAMVLAFLVRTRIDYRNHAIAAAMIIITFVWQSSFNSTLFLIFFITFVVFGSLRDYTGEIRKKKDWIYKYNEHPWYYIIPTAIFGVFTGNWAIFVVFTVYIVFYDLVKYGLFYAGKYKKL